MNREQTILSATSSGMFEVKAPADCFACTILYMTILSLIRFKWSFIKKSGIPRQCKIVWWWLCQTANCSIEIQQQQKCCVNGRSKNVMQRKQRQKENTYLAKHQLGSRVCRLGRCLRPFLEHSRMSRTCIIQRPKVRLLWMESFLLICWFLFGFEQKIVVNLNVDVLYFS